MPRSLDRAEERKEVPAESYAVEVRFTFCNVFLNLSARKHFWVGTVTGIGSGSVTMSAIVSDSGVWLNWAGSGIGMEIIGGVTAELWELESSG